jgi:hypothetical protein
MDLTILAYTVVAVLAIWLVKNLTEDVVVRIKRRYTWRKDIPDLRDKPFRYTAAPLPTSVDLRPLCPPVVDQGTEGSCINNACAGALGFLELQDQRAKLVGQPEEFNSDNFVPFSRNFLYYNIRQLEGDPFQDDGGQIRDGVKSLASTGCCSEITWPYSRATLFAKPSAASFSEAANHKITEYQSLDNGDINALKTCLAGGFPFVFGFTVFDSFESESVAANGLMPMPLPNDQEVGGHAVMAVGYDDARQVFIVRNSWGTSWGDGGYFYMPYSYITSPTLADDFWTLRK